jgi:hypothetical protein
MAENIVSAKVGEFNLGEAFAIGIAKKVSEQLLQPVIGNGSYMSGAVKIGAAYFLPKVWKGKISSVLATAWAVDGVEDMITQLFGSGVGPSTSDGMIL